MSGPARRTDEISERIRDLVLKGVYIAGEAMPEEELAERLSVSRTPIREALRRLQAEGLVERRSNRRVYLTEVSLATVVDIFEVRARVEPMAAGLAAAKVDATFLDLLGERIEAMDVARLAAHPDLRAYRQANEDFHWAILRQSGNGALDAAVRAIARRQLTSPTFNGWNFTELERSQNHHRELVAAFEIGDCEWAEAVMTAHLRAARATYDRIRTVDAKNDGEQRR